MIPHDYHLHSHYSCDCQSTMAEQCASAIAKGIPEIGLTDHFDLHPLDECSGYFKLAGWMAEI
ncbi:MAG: PHP domain-containing protein, partial [Chloroflexi bacterium]|nr:PHP domain-containing protein [Chloroflexota bacterium]